MVRAYYSQQGIKVEFFEGAALVVKGRTHRILVGSECKIKEQLEREYDLPIELPTSKAPFEI